MDRNSEVTYQRLVTVFFFTLFLLMMSASSNRTADNHASSVKPVSEHELPATVISESSFAVIQSSVKLPDFKYYKVVDPGSADHGFLSARVRLSGYSRSIDLNIILAQRTRLAIEHVRYRHNIYHAVSYGDDDGPVLS